MKVVSQATTPKPMVDQTSRDLDRYCHDHYAALVGFLGYCTRDDRLAEDLAQETLVRLVIHWDRVAAMESPDGWLYTTALNLARTRFRRRMTERRAYARVVNEERRSSTESISTTELDLRAQIRQLPRKQRAALACRYYLDLPVRDVAAVMHCSEAAVKSLLRNALKGLRVEEVADNDEP